MEVNLNFDRVYTPPAPGSPISLDFGEQPGEPPIERDWQGLRKPVVTRWQAAAGPLLRPARQSWRDCDTLLHRTVAQPWQAAAAAIIRQFAQPWERAEPISRAWRQPWASAEQIGRAWRQPWASAEQIGRAWRQPWASAQWISRAWEQPWQAAMPIALAVRIVWEGAMPLSRTVRIPWASPPLQRRTVRIPWEQAMPPPWVWPPPVPYVPPEPDPRVYIPPAPGEPVALDFGCPIERYLGGVPLAFREHACTPRAPYLRTYIIMASAALIRLSDGAPVAAASIQLSADLDSWSWGFNAKLRSAAALDLVKPGAGGPVLVQATINGHVFVAAVETWAQTRRHGYTEWTIQGRSRSALLADPYAASISYESDALFTANQLADNELPPSGWTLDWQTVDWQVPAGAYSYRDMPPLGAIGMVAESVGAVVQSHQADATIVVMPRYPLSPWDWAGATPAVTVTEDIIRNLATDWRPRPEWTGVYCMGTTQGVNVFVKRTGTAGDVLAGTVADPLITHVDAGRERGRNIIASGGRWSVETIELPLMVSPLAPGLLLPGTLIEVADGIATWRGQVMGVRVAAARQDGNDGRIEIWQTVEVERWHG